MKLYIKRDQAKGLLGGTKFELTAKAELTGEESSLVTSVRQLVIILYNINMLYDILRYKK